MYRQSMFGAKIRKIAFFFSAENFQFLKLKISLFIAWASFRIQCRRLEQICFNGLKTVEVFTIPLMGWEMGERLSFISILEYQQSI